MMTGYPGVGASFETRRCLIRLITHSETREAFISSTIAERKKDRKRKKETRMEERVFFEGGGFDFVDLTRLEP